MSCNVRLFQFLDLVYDNAPDIITGDVLLKYPSILKEHGLVEISNYARMALFKSSVCLQLDSHLEVFFISRDHEKYSTDPFLRMGNEFNKLSNDFDNFRRHVLPGDKLTEYSKESKIPYSYVYVMCISSYWLYARLVPNVTNFDNNYFIRHVSRRIIDFNEAFKIVSINADD